MRLKFLFFPFILIISVSIFAGYIWPEIDSMNLEKQTIEERKTQIADLEKKSLNIKNLGQKLATNSETEKLISSYLPVSFGEEKIISSLAYLANDSNLNLLNIGMGVDQEKEAGAGVVNAVVVKSDDSPVQKNSVTVSVSGSYEKILIFLDGVQRMPLYNEFKSVSIGKSKAETAKPAEGEQAQKNNDLVMELVIDFGYLDAKSAKGIRLDGLKDVLDESSILALSKFVSQKNQLGLIEAGSKGKTNPFFVD